MAVSKLVYYGQTKFDISDTTATPDKVLAGYTFYDNNGVKQIGAATTNKLTPEHFDYNIGYVDNGTWKYENPTRTYCDIYEVKAGCRYFISLGARVGSRFRAMFTTTDVTTSTSNVPGTAIINKNNPASYDYAVYKVTTDGYIIIGKDNVGKTGVYTYVYEFDESLMP